MKTIFTFLSIIPFIFLFIISCDTKPDLLNEEQNIRKLWDDACKFVCNGNWEEYSKLWDPSSEIHLMHPDQGEWLKGWEEVKNKYEALLKSGMKCSFPKNNLTLDISKSGDMAYGTTDMIIQFNDNNNTQIQAWQTVVFEKINGQWKMVLGHSSTPKIGTKE